MLTSLAVLLAGGGLVSFVIQIVILGLIFWLLWWLIHFIGIPQPFLKVLEVVLAVVGVLLLINALLSIGGHAVIAW